MGDSLLVRRSCVLVEDLCRQVKKLQEEVKRLRSIRDDKKEVNQISEISMMAKAGSL